jgi:hypothetical protein
MDLGFGEKASVLVVSTKYKHNTQGTRRVLSGFKPPEKKPYMMLAGLYY